MSVYLDDGDAVLHHGDALATLRTLPSASVHCIVTSPPFWALRDYGVDGQIGLYLAIAATRLQQLSLLGGDAA